MTALAQCGSPQQRAALATASAQPPPPPPALTAGADETPPPAAEKSTKRHWRALRNALLSRTPSASSSSERITTASAVSTEFFPVFPVRCCCAAAATTETERSTQQKQHQHDENFEWLQYELAMSPEAPSAVAVRVREKKASARVTVAELLSHQVNRGVDNTGNVRTWPSEQLLLAYLLRNGVCQKMYQSRGGSAAAQLPLSVCELGSGMVGLASLGLLAHAPAPFARVDITDGNPQSVGNLELCVAENAALIASKSAGARVAVKLLRWDRDAVFAATERHKFDLLLASDCLFFEEFHADLAYTIKELLRPTTGRCFLLQPSRNGSMERFVVVAERQGLLVERCDAFDPDVARLHLEHTASRDDYEPDVHLPVLLIVTTRA